jgi:Got1/Sft2-like family
MSLFDTYLKVDYRRLLPGGEGPEAAEVDVPTDFGLYEDEESRAARNPFYMGEAGFTCPSWINDRMPQLSLRERILGCVTCMVCGYLLGFGSFIRMTQMIKGNPVPLVVHITLGNILTLCGTCFLTGPQQQARRMFHESRKVASVMYLGGMGLTLFLLFMPPFPTRGFCLVLLLIGQYAAITWYCLSYIPFARDIVKRFCRRVITQSESAGDDF